MLTAQVAATKTDLKAIVAKGSKNEVAQEVTTEAAAEIATSPIAEGPKTEATKEVKAEINKVSFNVLITRLFPQFHFLISQWHSPSSTLISSNTKTPTHLHPAHTTTTEAISPHRHRHQHPARSP